MMMPRRPTTTKAAFGRVSVALVAVAVACAALLLPPPSRGLYCEAFSPSSELTGRSAAAAAAAAASATSTALGGLFGRGESEGGADSAGGILGNLFGGVDSGGGPKTVVDLPAKEVKAGALRFLLQIYLVGEQNKPEPKSWLTKQGGDGELEVYYKDGTGMLSIGFQDYGIKMVRNGAQPSLQYVLQESVLLHGILDELDGVAFGVVEEGISEDKRLLRLNGDDAINKARESLPARKEDE